MSGEEISQNSVSQTFHTANRAILNIQLIFKSLWKSTVELTIMNFLSDFCGVFPRKSQVYGNL